MQGSGVRGWGRRCRDSLGWGTVNKPTCRPSYLQDFEILMAGCVVVKPRSDIFRIHPAIFEVWRAVCGCLQSYELSVVQVAGIPGAGADSSPPSPPRCRSTT